MDPELSQRLAAQDEKLSAILASVEKTRRYFKLTLIISVVVIVLPLIGLLFVIPQFLNVLGSGIVLP